ncbi:MAG: preprotein translocase subunit YajC [Candidatus Binatus sp.]|uniref:preprotein translocase subunit YajC n=1 Tax=Candidatus Binatus sp. TaxID=2811406 RepID=UPI00271B9FEB|nr:preprotein translocase subunit YajC [Candidatus Binatus sp.]MDO8432882.1 preprotein translocase subunit YajC [Candidatus Binatus sp.]
MLFEGTAYAQAAAGAGAGGEQVIYTTVVPLALLFGIFYFLLIRPQTKKAQEHSKMLKDLKRNDEVVTTGGVIGRIVELGDTVVTLEVAPNVRIRVERAQIANVSTYGKGGGKKE